MSRTLVLLAWSLVAAACLGPGPEPASSADWSRQQLTLPAGEAVSGVATFSRGNGHGQTESYPVEVTGAQVWVAWPALGYGNWKLTLELFGAQGQQVYRAEDRFVVNPNRPQPMSLTLLDQAGAAVTVSDRAGALLFWNTLDDPLSVASSRVGVPGEPHGTLDFAPVRYGNGVGNVPDSWSYVSFDGLFPPEVRTAFAVEAWVQWGELSRSNYSPFTVQGAADDWGGVSFNIGVAQSPAGPGRMIRDVAVILQWEPTQYLEYIWRLDVPATSFVQHLAVSADLAAPAPQKFKLYLDGVEQGAANWAAIEVDPQAAFTFPPYVRIGQSVVGNPWVLGCYVDNLKVWSYPKTDYSDRLVE